MFKNLFALSIFNYFIDFHGLLTKVQSRQFYFKPKSHTFYFIKAPLLILTAKIWNYLNLFCFFFFSKNRRKFGCSFLEKLMESCAPGFDSWTFLFYIYRKIMPSFLLYCASQKSCTKQYMCR